MMPSIVDRIARKNRKSVNKRYYPAFHFAPLSGWMNDPNGFNTFMGYYHLFYQYYPFDSHKGKMHWGHARSKNLVNWEYLPIALYPDKLYDKDGCYSGSSIVKKNDLYLIYTGNKLKELPTDKKDYVQSQNLAVSNDGINFKKISSNPIIPSPPPDSTKEFRDPKIWFKNGKYYLLVGNQGKKDKNGRVILYESTDMSNWKYKTILAQSKNNSLGYMWECPDFFSLDGIDVLLFSPQGIAAQSDKYNNEFQSGYFLGKFDYATNHYSHRHFHELDFGHDFYAPQTTVNSHGERIIIGWMNMWHSNFPEQIDNWCGEMTMPRILKIKNNKLFSEPYPVYKELRAKILLNQLHTKIDELAILYPTDMPQLEIKLTISNAKTKKGKIGINIFDDTSKIMSYYDFATQKFIVNRNGDIRERKIIFDDFLQIHSFIDRSSIETFLNGGQQVYSSRFYLTQHPHINFFNSSATSLNIIVYLVKQANFIVGEDNVNIIK